MSRVFQNWTFVHHLGSPFLTWEQVRKQKLDGLIAPLQTTRHVEWATSSSDYCVNYSAMLERTGCSSVISDDERIGQEAAIHLTGRGIPHLTAIYEHQAAYGQRRVQTCEEQAGPLSTWEEPFHLAGSVPLEKEWVKRLPAFRTWLRNLPKPCGVFATHNALATLAMQISLEEGIQIPTELALLGVSHSSSRSAFLPIPLSFIPLNGRQVGRTCAEMLQRLMLNQERGPRTIEVPPLPVLAEQSTAYERVQDPLICPAMDRLQGDLSGLHSVADLMKGIPLSRRSFETRFKEASGNSPRVELERMRILQTKRLLLHTSLGMQEIADRVGFSDARQVTLAFSRCVGCSPSTFRRQGRL